MDTRTGLFIQMKDYQPGVIQKTACKDSLIYCSAENLPQDADLIGLLKQMVKETHESESSLILQYSRELAGMDGFNDQEELAYGLDVDYLHFDHSWPVEEVKEAALRIPQVVSVSSLSLADRFWYRNNCPNVLFIHDYYRRKDTGLDQKVFDDLSEGIRKEDLVVFVPGTPLEQRNGTELSTLEIHRHQTPYAASIDLINQGVGGIIYTTTEIGAMEMNMINRACDGVYGIPASLNCPELYHQSFTIRSDSPQHLKRLKERPQGLCMPIEADIPVARKPGFITMDNENYPDSQVSVMICNGDYQADASVNVIGHVCDYYLPVLDLLQNGSVIEFIKPNMHG